MPEQRSEAWREARRGMITASEFHAILHASAATLQRLARKKRGEIQGEGLGQFDSAATDWGVRHEAQGLALLSLHPPVQALGPIEPCELQIHPQHFYIGASPDGLIGTATGVELKCPYNAQIHRDTLRLGMPAQHMAQIQGGMWVTGRSQWWFGSFDPRLLATDQALYAQRIPRDDNYIQTLAWHVLNFWEILSGQRDAFTLDPLNDPIPTFFA